MSSTPSYFLFPPAQKKKKKVAKGIAAGGACHQKRYSVMAVNKNSNDGMSNGKRLQLGTEENGEQAFRRKRCGENEGTMERNHGELGNIRRSHGALK